MTSRTRSSITQTKIVLTNAMPEHDAICFWRDDVDSLAFRPDGHEGWCVIHRRAFRAILGFEPAPNDCLNYFEKTRTAFHQAARAKIRRAEITPASNFHLNSRDMLRGSVHSPR
ncbi:MAG: DUF1488 family protein, partial [Spongiibacteraceae bacterium]